MPSAAARVGIGRTWGSGVGQGRAASDAMGRIVVMRPNFEAIEDFLRDNASSRERAAMGMDLLIQTIGIVTKGLAQQRSAGAVAPRQRSNPALAYRIPVQRITGAYFAGWTLKRTGVGRYLLYNDTVEAYLIETGMYMRVRRPILKLSVLGMLKFIQTTRTADRFLDWVIAPRRDAQGKFQSFKSRAFGGNTMNTLSGPVGRLPS